MAERPHNVPQQAHSSYANAPAEFTIPEAGEQILVAVLPGLDTPEAAPDTHFLWRPFGAVR